MGKHLALVAGEASGDLIAAPMIAALRSAHADWRFSGVGGPAMLAQGFENQAHIDALAVRGYVEVIRHLPRLLRLRRRLFEHYTAAKPDLFLGVDAPDFNLNLEAKLKARGVPTAHFISPSIWAWRPERIEKIRHAVNHMLLVFPFEKAIYDKAGIASTYVGHPMADSIPLDIDTAAARQTLGLALDAPVLAILPGSRAAEIDYLLPRFLAAAALLKKDLPSLQCVLPVASPALNSKISALVAASGLAVQCVAQQADACLAACDATLIASGTATLQAALYKKPMVISYAMPQLSYWLMKNKGLLPWVGLPNILCQDWVVPELIQAAATPSALAQALLPYFTEPSAAAKVKTRFAALHASLRCDMPRRAASCIEGLLR